jgi:hypothetical protein
MMGNPSDGDGVSFVSILDQMHMKNPPVTPPLLGLLVLSACSSPSGRPNPDGDGNTNPKVLYLANDVFETRVKLVDTEPPPF